MAIELDQSVLEEFRSRTLKHVQELLTRKNSFGFEKRFGFSKVDDEARTIEGICASETEDLQGEILEYDGIKEALSKWSGNVREMHSDHAAVGRALEVRFDDAAKAAILKAYISKGAQSTWEKIKDGTLRAWSIGGNRLRSSIDANGVRRTKSFVLREISVVDSPANPQCSFSLVKIENERPVQSQILRTNGEAFMSCATGALRKVSRTLASGSRPLPSEVSGALEEISKSLGTPEHAECTTIAQLDFAQRGPGWGKQLESLVAGIEASEEDASRAAILKASQLLLLSFVQTGAVRPNLKKTGARAVSAPLTVAELRSAEAALCAAIRKWDEASLPQTDKRYEQLTRNFFKISAMIRRGEKVGVR